MNDRCSAPRRRTLALLAVLGGAMGSCAEVGNPFVTSLSDLGPLPPAEQTRVIDPLSPEKYAVSPGESDDPRSARKDPFAGLERLEVSLEQARAWTLQNNLDLQVALIDPAIANESLSEEEGRFESVLFTRARYANLDQPTASTLAGSQIKTLDVEPGVRVPLRTGGSATVSFPVNRTETNNIFSTLNPAYESDFQFSLTQPLLRNAGRRAATFGVRIASLNKQISIARTKLEVIRQLAAVERAYWRLYAAQKALEVRQMQHELADEQLRRARRRVDAGSSPEIEITRAEAGLSDRLVDIITAENDLRNVQRDFKRIVNVPGLPIGSPVLIVASTPPDPVKYLFETNELTDRAVAQRMEMLELELRLAQDEASIAFQRNQALPLFTLDYTYRLNGLGRTFPRSLDLLDDGDFDDHVFGVNFEAPIGNVQGSARVERAILTRLQRLSTREARRQAITQEVLNAADAVEAGWQRIIAARQSTVLNTRTLQGEQRQFDVGGRTSTDVLDSSTRLADAQLIELRSLVEYQVALVDLAFATGTLLGASRVSWEPLDPRPDPPQPSLFWGRHPIAEPPLVDEAAPEVGPAPEPVVDPAP